MNLTIEGQLYSKEQMQRNMQGSSMLMDSIGSRGEIYRDLALFLMEFFDDSKTLSVQTSGSTGTAKIMQVEKEKMLNSARMTVDFLGLKEGDTALLCMPLKYIAGKMMIVRSLLRGLNIILKEPDGNPMRGVNTKINFSAMIPLQVYNTLKNKEERAAFEAIDNVIIGGGAIDEAMENELKAMSNNLYSTYGMTETLSHIALRRISGANASLWYIPFDNVKLTQSEEGTLIIDAKHVSDEVLKTNDIVEFNDRGHFRIIGRKDNIINSGGVKIQIEKVEEAIKGELKKQGVELSFMVSSLKDEKFGERVVLVIDESAPDNAVESLTKAFAALEPYQRPKNILKTSALPFTGTGKPQRATVKELAKTAKVLA